MSTPLNNFGSRNNAYYNSNQQVDTLAKKNNETSQILKKTTEDDLKQNEEDFNQLLKMLGNSNDPAEMQSMMGQLVQKNQEQIARWEEAQKKIAALNKNNQGAL